MGETTRFTDPDEREANLGLWAVPGIGAITIEKLEAALRGKLRALIDAPVADWPTEAKDVIRGDYTRDFLNSVTTLRELAATVRALAARTRMELAFPGDGNYPAALLDIHDPPRVLFHYGEMSAPRRRAAIVGSRQAEGAAEDFARQLGCDLAKCGVGVISGAAIGIDMAGHEGALAGGGETWAFLATSLDQMDSTQKPICRKILKAGGMIFSEYPPNTRAKKEHFPRRNRLVTGSADAVVAVRAGFKSGTLHSIEHATAQGRPLLVVPSDPWASRNEGGNAKLSSGAATPCFGYRDVLRELNLSPHLLSPAPVGVSLEDLKLSDQAKRALVSLSRTRRVFDDILEDAQMDASQLVSALTELELNGLAMQHPGKVYERV